MDLRKMTMDQLLQPKSGVPWRQAYPEIQRRRGLPERAKPYAAMTQAERAFFYSPLATASAPERPPRAAKAEEDPPASPVAPSCSACGKTIADDQGVVCGPCAGKGDEKDYERPASGRSCARCDKPAGRSPYHSGCVQDQGEDDGGEEAPPKENETMAKHQTAPEPDSMAFNRLANDLHDNLTPAQFAHHVEHRMLMEGISRAEAVVWVTCNARALADKPAPTRGDFFGFSTHAAHPPTVRVTAPRETEAEAIERKYMAKARAIAERDKIGMSAAIDRVRVEDSALYRQYAANVHR